MLGMPIFEEIRVICGAKEDRTPDLLNAIQALSQLSYSPKHIEIKQFYKIIFRVSNQYAVIV